MAEWNADIVVVGGGVAGMEAAGSLADLGHAVTLIERDEHLGGNASGWACMATTACAKCSTCLVEDSIARVGAHPKVKVLTHAELDGVERKAEGFSLSVRPVRGTMKARCGHLDWSIEDARTIDCRKVVLATGFRVFEARDQRLLGFGHLPEVFTTQSLDEVLKEDDLSQFIPEGMEKPRVAFIQCVGSRDRAKGREYCSQVCCKISIRLARKLLHLCPDAEITLYYIDLQLMGKEFRSFYQEASKKVNFVQGVPAEVRVGSEEGLVKVVGVSPETGLGEVAEYNRVVLSVGLAPESRNDALHERFGVKKNEFGFLAGMEDGPDFLGAPDVYLAGTCAGPTDIPTSRLQAMAVARRVSESLNEPSTAAAARA